MTKVVHFMRNPGRQGFSIERVFAEVRAELPDDIFCTVRVSKFASRGIVRRLYCIVEAAWCRGEVNHVTGDTHYLVLGLPGNRSILSVMDCGNLRGMVGWRRALMKFFWFSWPIRSARIVTTISEATRQELISFTNVSPEKVRVIHCCLSTDFRPSPMGFNASQPRILLIGTTPNKNLERMAKALAGIRCSVELIGFPSEAQISAFEGAGTKVKILGNVTDAEIVDAYRRCDMLLFASTYEGFGMPIIEAQAVGRPVVTANCSSMVEVAGESACLVDPFDPASIRAGVERIIADAKYRDELIRLGLVNVRRFSATKIASDYAAIYREIARRGR